MPRRSLLTLLAALVCALALPACGGDEAGGEGGGAAGGGDPPTTEASNEPAVPGFCADEQGRGHANLLYQVLPQIAASPDGGRSLLESPVFEGPDLDALVRHVDAVEEAPASDGDAGGEVKDRYVEAMRSGVEAYRSAKQGDPSKLAAASPAVEGAYLAFATPYACS